MKEKTQQAVLWIIVAVLSASICYTLWTIYQDHQKLNLVIQFLQSTQKQTPVQ